MDERGQFIAEVIDSAPRALAAGVLMRQQELAPETIDPFADGVFGSLSDATEGRLLFLAEALAAGRPALFRDHLGWWKIAHAARGAPPEFLVANLRAIRAELEDSLPVEHAPMVGEYIADGLAWLESAPSEVASLLEGEHPHVDLARRFLVALLEARRDDAVRMVLEAADSGVPVPELQRHVLGRVQAEMGRMWQMAEIHVSEEHLGSRVVEELLVHLRTLAPRPPRVGRRVIVGSVSGDLHDIGSRMVADHFDMSGWDVLFLGANTPAEDIAHAVRDFRADLVAISAAIALHVRSTARLVERLKSELGSQRVPVLVGGGPFNTVPDLWQAVGASGSAREAEDAVGAGLRLVAGH